MVNYDNSLFKENIIFISKNLRENFFRFKLKVPRGSSAISDASLSTIGTDRRTDFVLVERDVEERYTLNGRQCNLFLFRKKKNKAKTENHRGNGLKL